MRHCFATRLLEDGYDIRTARELLGHPGIRTTMAFHEAGVGRELLHAIKARNVVDLIEDRQCQDLTNAWD